MLRKIGRSSSFARASASGPHGDQSTGLSACWRRYGLVSVANRLGIRGWYPWAPDLDAAALGCDHGDREPRPPLPAERRRPPFREPVCRGSAPAPGTLLDKPLRARRRVGRTVRRDVLVCP